MLEKKKEKYFYTSSDLAKLLTVRLKRRVRASHVDEVAVKLGRSKMYLHDRQTVPTYYWVEDEIQTISEML
jgi:hypothetical protein